MLPYIALLITTLFFIILDSIWFASYSYKAIYAPLFASIQGNPPPKSIILKIGGGLFAWLLLAFGIRYFVLQNNEDKINTFLRGALFGFVVYGIYNGTNYATLDNYDARSAIYDTAWGTLASAMVSFASSFL